jgi:hypothetical protein
MATPAVQFNPLRIWVPGPERPVDRVVVSVTDFSLFRRRDTPGVLARGLRLALGWYAMEGAVGLWLWSLPGQWRSGSITVWTGERELRRFVGLPAHRAIMDRYRDRGDLRATAWHADRPTPADVLGQARTWLSDTTVPA